MQWIDFEVAVTKGPQEVHGLIIFHYMDASLSEKFYFRMKRSESSPFPRSCASGVSLMWERPMESFERELANLRSRMWANIAMVEFSKGRVLIHFSKHACRNHMYGSAFVCGEHVSVK